MPDWYAYFRVPLLFLQSMVGVQLFAYTLELRRPRWLIPVWILLGLVICHVSGQLLYTKDQDIEGILRRIMSSVVVYFMVIAVVWLSYRISIWTCLFVTSSGYIAQDLAGSVKGLLKLVPWGAEVASDPVGILAVDLLCYGGIFILLFFTFRPFTRRRDENFDNKLKAIFSFGVLLLCIGMARLTQDNPERNLIACFSESLYSVITGIFVLLLQFGTMEHAKLHHSVDAMREMLRQQQQQYEVGKASMQLVNEKYHDLKALLQSFGGHISPAQLEKLEDSIDKYDLYIHTGNEVLDVLLTEKRTLCQGKGIRLTCFLDGKDFSFMEELDLYSLLGNALNNAIEAVDRLPEGEERFISLTAQRENGMLLVHLENPFSGTLRFTDGLPESSGDPRYHGFGMKSMAHIAEKYGGSLSVRQADGRFYLDILLFTL